MCTSGWKSSSAAVQIQQEDSEDEIEQLECGGQAPKDQSDN